MHELNSKMKLVKWHCLIIHVQFYRPNHGNTVQSWKNTTKQKQKTMKQHRKNNEPEWKSLKKQWKPLKKQWKLMNTTEKKNKMNNIQLNKWKNIEQTMKVMHIHEKSKNEQPYI